MYHVLLPADANTERALAAADAVTALPHAADAVRVTILNVQEEVEILDTEGGRVSSAEWYDETDFPESVEEARGRLADAGISVETRREHAAPAEAIVETARELDAELIVMAGRKRTPAGKVLFGSVTQSVLLDSPVPVAIVSE